MAASSNAHLYADCRHIERSKPDFHVTEEIAKEIGSEYRTLPMFETGLYEVARRRHSSLRTNELLRCRWVEYKRRYDERKFAPFQFFNIRDIHFHNMRLRILPSESIYQYPEHKMKLKAGPGVDNRGQMPIPQDLLMKRGGKVGKQHGGEKKVEKKKKSDDKEK